MEKVARIVMNLHDDDESSVIVCPHFTLAAKLDDYEIIEYIVPLRIFCNECKKQFYFEINV